MTRIALIAGLVGSIALSLGAVSANAAVYRTGHAVHAGRPSIVETVRHSRYIAPRHHRHHWYRFWR